MSPLPIGGGGALARGTPTNIFRDSPGLSGIKWDKWDSAGTRIAGAGRDPGETLVQPAGRGPHSFASHGATLAQQPRDIHRTMVRGVGSGQA